MSILKHLVIKAAELCLAISMLLKDNLLLFYFKALFLSYCADDNQNYQDMPITALWNPLVSCFRKLFSISQEQFSVLAQSKDLMLLPTLLTMHSCIRVMLVMNCKTRLPFRYLFTMLSHYTQQRLGLNSTVTSEMCRAFDQFPLISTRCHPVLA